MIDRDKPVRIECPRCGGDPFLVSDSGLFALVCKICCGRGWVRVLLLPEED